MISEGPLFLKPTHAAWTDFYTFIHGRFTLFTLMEETGRTTPTRRELWVKARGGEEKKKKRTKDDPFWSATVLFFKSLLYCCRLVFIKDLVILVWGG